MPLVSRKIVVENENTTFSKDVIDHITYVKPKDVKPTDVEVEPSSPEQLAELAQMYPKEYGDKAKAAGISPNQGTGRLARLLEMNAKELVRQINDMSVDVDEDVLWALYEAEINGVEGSDEEPKNRQTVLQALEAKGVKE